MTAATVMWEVRNHIADGKVSAKLKSATVIVRQTVDSPKDFVYENLLFLCLPQQQYLSLEQRSTYSVFVD